MRRGFLALIMLVLVVVILAAWAAPAIYRACTGVAAAGALFVQLAALVRWLAEVCGYLLAVVWFVREASDWPTSRDKWPWLRWGLAVAAATALMLVICAALGMPEWVALN